MESFRVRSLYDFTGEPNTAELSISAGQILTVIRTDVGEGWWEGINENGRSGLFPQAYVEKIDFTQPPAAPPPTLPPPNNVGWSGTQPVPVQSTVSQEDDWDDDWDNDETYSEIGGNNVPPVENIYSNDRNLNSNNLPPDFPGESNLNIDGTVNPTSNCYKIKIRKENETIRWDPITNPYTVQIASPKKASKMGGLKSFIAYHVTPSFSGIEVARRYKHFDWLHDRLRAKYNIISIPPLPDKQVSGRYEEHFIEHRRMQLQEFINYMCRHPVLSQSEVWHHFLTCTDEKQWKQGKRNAERDQMVGANFCLQIDAPDKELLASNVEATMEMNINSINQIDQALKGLMQTVVDQQKKCSNMYKREMQKVGESFFALGTAFESAEKGMFSDFTTDIKRMGSTYMTIGKLFEDQSKVDWQSLADKLYIYKGITGCYPDIFCLQRSAEQKKRECEKNVQVQQPQLLEIRKRTDVLTYAVFAELAHFHSEKDGEIKQAMKLFLQEQVNFYKNIVSKLEDTLQRFQ
ncbi:sorting nexin lst-4 isoform X2 [Harmonia axyridis]|uniref:sorting nexin lst-4 isoform X2 n=1 Tax=Harmonia axyridis TaxID=115357 RepID=UPI001E2764FF|nr:sorting nexin lst-4 isoform X2 [Harmonia axyridis]